MKGWLPYFNPRSLAGATSEPRDALRPYRYFNPRSLAGATAQRANAVSRINISIHAPSRERQQMRYPLAVHFHFNPRSLAGATEMNTEDLRYNSISIHAPLRERLYGGASRQPSAPFQSTLPCGSDPAASLRSPPDVVFQSTLPCGSDCLMSFFGKMLI